MTLNSNTTCGAKVAVDTDPCDECAQYQIGKLAFGPLNTFTLVSACNGLPVQGTVTANLSATDNAVLDTIDSVLDTIKIDTEAIETAVEIIDNAVHVDDAAFTLGTSSGVMMMGFAGTQSVDANDAGAIAIDTDGAVHVADGGNSLTVDNAGLTELAAAINGCQVDVDIKASDVDLMLGTDFSGVLGSTNIVYTEDAAAAANPLGFSNILVRDDTPGTLTSTDGDNVAQRGTNYGAAFVQVVDSCGNFVDTFGGSGGTAMTDDAAFTAGTTQGTPAFAMFDDTTPDSVNEGDGGIVRMSANRNLYTTIRDAAGNERGVNVDACNQLTVVEASAAGILADTAAIQTAVEIIDNAVHVDDAAFTLGTHSGIMMMGFAGTQSVNANDAGAIAMDIDGAIHISDGNNSITVDNANLTELGAAINCSVLDVCVQNASLTVDLGANNDVTATGNVAHDAADSGNPVKVGGRAQALFTAAEQASADNDRVDALFDRNGFLHVRGALNPATADINDSTSGNNTIIAAQGANKRIAVFGYHIVSDGTTDVRWEDGACGTAFTGQVPLQAREGLVVGYGPNPVFVGAANTLLNLELTAAINVHGQVSYEVWDDA